MRVSVYIAITIDGFIARDDGDVSWLDEYHQAPDVDYGFSAFFASVDCLVMGRTTFEKVLSFDEWGYGDKPIAVLSHAKVAIPEHLSSTVESMSGPPAEIVERLAVRGFEHLYVDGGATVRRFLADDLVDSLVLTLVPLLLGSGVPLFETLPRQTALRHVATESFPSGLVQSTYRVDRHGAGDADEGCPPAGA